MVFKKILTIIIGTIISFSANAEMRSQAFLGYDGLSFGRNTDDFISSQEAADLESYNLGGYIVKDISETTSLSILGKYVEYNTGNFDDPEDDSPKDILSFETTLIQNLFKDSLGGFGVYYADIETKQDDLNANKTIQGYNVSFVNDFNKITYMVTLGEQTEGSSEVEDNVRNAQYAGIAFNYQYDEIIDFGFKYNTFVGEEYDEETIQTEQTTNVFSLFVEYKLPAGSIKTGYKDYYNWEVKDVEGSGYGEIDEANGDAFFLTYSLPFGNPSSKKERMLITEKPDIVEFSTIGGSLGD